MADDNQKAAQRFLEAWSIEFEKSAELIAGQSIKVERAHKADSGETAGGEASMLWQGQTFQRERTATVWIGSPIETYTALTQGSAANSDERQSRYRQALRKSLEAAAQTLSSDRTPKLVCKEAIEDRFPTLAELDCVEPVSVLTAAGARFSILVAVQSGFAALLNEASPLSPVLSVNALDAPQASTRLDRMVDLELPMTVVLGRAKLQIRDVLKLAAGSLIELDRRVGDPVEIIVHDVVVARGEVVAAGRNYGVKIQEVVSRGDRGALRSAGALPTLRVSQQPSVN